MATFHLRYPGGLNKALTFSYDDGHDCDRRLAELLDKYGMKCWTNFESFDRDMPIRFLPIKWEKLLLKMEMARKAGMDGAITFEFSHFMSPNSEYQQAGHLYDRYCEHFGIKNRWKNRTSRR